MGTLYYGDNLDILRRYLKDETVDLVYLDPPFNSAQNYNAFFQEEGSRVVTAPRCADGGMAETTGKGSCFRRPHLRTVYCRLRKPGPWRGGNNTLRECRHSALRNKERHEQSRLACWR